MSTTIKKYLKNKYFGTDGIRGRVGCDFMNPEFVLKLGWALGQILNENNKQDKTKKVIIGKDTRISGYMFESALEAGLSASGIDIYLLGPLPTPAIAYITRVLRADAGIVISASHNPYYDNGIKFFNSDGIKFPDEIEKKIEKTIDLKMHTVEAAELGKAMRFSDAKGRYIEFCKSTFPTKLNLNGMHIGLDCANGASYEVAPYIFNELGAKVNAIAVQPNGININEQSGAVHAETLAKHVVQNKLDVGFALDGDGDRLIAVDEKGEILDGDTIIYVIAKYCLATKTIGIGDGVVGTYMTNTGLERELLNLGFKFSRVDVGDRYVYEELKKNNWKLGGEPSGHIIWLPCSTTSDPHIAALKILAYMLESGQPLSKLRSGISKIPQKVTTIECKAMNKNKINAVSKIIEETKASLKSGRILFRQSGTEAAVRILVESDLQKDVDEISTYLTNLIKERIECS